MGQRQRGVRNRLTCTPALDEVPSAPEMPPGTKPGSQALKVSFSRTRLDEFERPQLSILLEPGSLSPPRSRSFHVAAHGRLRLVLSGDAFVHHRQARSARSATLRVRVRHGIKAVEEDEITSEAC